MQRPPTNSLISDPVTIGDLRREGKLLEVWCSSCRRIAYVDPKELPLPDAQPVPKAWRHFRCDTCHERAGYSRPDARVIDVDGKYPKF